jgi:hypothetical protein
LGCGRFRSEVGLPTGVTHLGIHSLIGIAMLSVPDILAEGRQLVVLGGVHMNNTLSLFIPLLCEAASATANLQTGNEDDVLLLQTLVRASIDLWWSLGLCDTFKSAMQ